MDIPPATEVQVDIRVTMVVDPAAWIEQRPAAWPKTEPARAKMVRADVLSSLAVVLERNPAVLRVEVR
ncbi:MAG: hypothetical protein M3Q39_15950 [Actinomycetota bacterium]|nr:hypothetical protein [Actinomycetota bacterium]